MSEVSVLFQGMVLWWAASTPAVVLVPDLTEADIPHRASIRAQKTAFVGDACPAGFENINNDICYFSLKDAGKTGGVQIELLSNTPAPASAALFATSMCGVPALQHEANETYVLLDDYKPQTGSKNLAWMSARLLTIVRAMGNGR
jgi:hypothetical protein